MNIIYNLEEPFDRTKNTIFLAGGTSRIDITNSWRKEAIDILIEQGFEGNVIVPEPRNGFFDSTTFDKIVQIKWERKCLAIANIILFWIPRDLNSLPCLTTNIEFGEWFKSNKCVLGIPNTAERMDYIKFLWQEYYSSEKLFDNLAEQIEYILTKLNREPKDFFTSDTHFSQERTLEFSKRPFKSVYDMDDTLISNWNSVVYAQDTMFHLGDFGIMNEIKYLSSKTIKLLRGNYDTSEFIAKLLDFDDRVVIIESNYDYCGIKLIHEPENAINKDYFYLFGHIHNNQRVKKNGLNVGTDCHNFYPIDLKTIMFYKEAIEKHYDENVFQYELGK